MKRHFKQSKDSIIISNTSNVFILEYIQCIYFMVFFLLSKTLEANSPCSNHRDVLGKTS